MNIEFLQWLSVGNDSKGVQLSDIPTLSYQSFCDDLREMMSRKECRITAYFAAPCSEGLAFYCLVADDSCAAVLIASHKMDYYAEQYAMESLAVDIPQIQLFEREIAELYGINFTGHPWFKPVRFPFNRCNPLSRIDNYPFYNMQSRELHLVNVGPVHACIIEPGAFRFICDGEKILHLEIALGYQHRGIESLICNSTNRLRQIALAESIAGDTAVGHAIAMARIMDAGECGDVVAAERIVALEMERIAMHLADTGALCLDIAFQIGQVACEALRTIVINSQQRWSGNRFGKGLIRPFGSNFRANTQTLEMIRTNLSEMLERYNLVAEDILSSPSVLARMEEICVVTEQQAVAVGAVGMAARSVALGRDCRVSHPFDGYCDPIELLIEPGGDLLSRLRLRMREIRQSYYIINRELDRLMSLQQTSYSSPNYSRAMAAQSLIFSMVEGWRGEICHVALTDHRGEFASYKIYDPSFHNWMMLALSVRDGQISDFPVSNKSYNLSYCGYDL